MHGEEAADGGGRRKERRVRGGGRDGGEIKRDEQGWEMKGVVVVEEGREEKGRGQKRRGTGGRERERESSCV